MPYQDSPGWERQWKNYPWQWDFHVSTVSEGHRVVGDKDKSDAKTKGAKLTFGEVLDCGVAMMLDNLGAPHKSTFHDLGMGPGKMLIQTYLQYNNFHTCMGVELAKGRYDLGERNIRTLLKTGWRGRTFLGVEFKKGEFFKIVEDVPNKTPENGWNIGDKVVAYYPLFKKDKMMVKDYHGCITDIKTHPSGDFKKNIYAIQYDDGTKCDRVQHRYLFIPGTERTCEVWFGSLFDYPGGFNAEMCILETDFPEEMHPNLIECMCTTPVGCTFLTYHDLKKFKCFDWNQLRQIDCNIYDKDRYITSWSQGWRFYIWEHIAHFNKTEAFVSIRDKLKIDDQILFKSIEDKSDNNLQYGEILSVSYDGEEDKKSDDGEFNLIVRTNKIQSQKVHYQNVTLSSSEYVVFLSRHRFRIGEAVSAYYVEDENKYQPKYDIYKAKVIAVNSHRLSYVIKYIGEGATKLDVPEKHVYLSPKLLYKPGDEVMACWPRNAQNKNCPHRYKRFPAEVIDMNNDSTYRLRFKVSPYLLSLLRPQTFPEDYEESEENKKQAAYAPTPDHCIAETVREMWIQEPAKFVLENIAKIEAQIGTPFYTHFEAQLVSSWNVNAVCEWLGEIGLEKMVSLFTLNKINGKMLLNIQSNNDRDLRVELNKLLVVREMENNSLNSSDNKTESVEINNNNNHVGNGGLGLNRIELRNLLANIKHLKSQHHLYESQYGSGGGGKDYSRLQQYWQNFRKEMGGGGGGGSTGGSGPIEDTDRK